MDERPKGNCCSMDDPHWMPRTNHLHQHTVRIIARGAGREPPKKRKAPAFAGAFLFWRRHPDLNRGSRICSPMPYHLAMAPSSGDARSASLSAAGQSPSAKSFASTPASLLSNPKLRFEFVGSGLSRSLYELLFCRTEKMERATRLELATSTLARWRSTG